MTTRKVNALQVNNEILQHRDEWLKEETAKCLYSTNDDDFFTNVYLHGNWLSLKLAEFGADDDTIERVCFAAGQRMAMSSNYDQTVADCWNRFVDNDIDTPGFALAKKLLDIATKD